MSNKKVCCVKGCPSLQANSKVKLYTYPCKSTKRYKRWKTLFPNSFNLYAHKVNYICRRHFTAESFDNKLKLKQSADPTIDIKTSNAQEQTLLRTFIIKVIYEWSLRNNVSDENLICKKALEAKDLLGIPHFKAQSWIANFVQIRQEHLKNGIRYGEKRTDNMQLVDVIRDLRYHLPSNYSLPVDMMNVTLEGDQLQVKNECNSDDDDMSVKLSQQSALVESAEKDNQKTIVEPVSQQALDTYQEALALLKPLEGYITRIANENALVRLREVETVVKQVIETETRPRRTIKRNRYLDD